MSWSLCHRETWLVRLFLDLYVLPQKLQLYDRPCRWWFSMWLIKWSFLRKRLWQCLHWWREPSWGSNTTVIMSLIACHMSPPRTRVVRWVKSKTPSRGILSFDLLILFKTLANKEQSLVLQAVYCLTKNLPILGKTNFRSYTAVHCSASYLGLQIALMCTPVWRWTDVYFLNTFPKNGYFLNTW